MKRSGWLGTLPRSATIEFVSVATCTERALDPVRAGSEFAPAPINSSAFLWSTFSGLVIVS